MHRFACAPPLMCALHVHPLSRVLHVRAHRRYFKTELETLSLAVTSPEEFLALQTTLGGVRADLQPALSAAAEKVAAGQGTQPAERPSLYLPTAQSRQPTVA